MEKLIIVLFIFYGNDVLGQIFPANKIDINVINVINIPESQYLQKAETIEKIKKIKKRIDLGVLNLFSIRHVLIN